MWIVKGMSLVFKVIQLPWNLTLGSFEAVLPSIVNLPDIFEKKYGDFHLHCCQSLWIKQDLNPQTAVAAFTNMV